MLALVVLSLCGCSQVDYLALSPDMVTLKQPNNEVWLVAKGMSRTGRAASGIGVKWSMGDGTVASIDATGKVKPLKSGRTWAEARYGSVTARVPVEVLYVEKIAVEPAEVTLVEGGPGVDIKVSAFDFEGNPIKDRTPALHALSKGIVNAGPGILFGLEAGETEVEVQVDAMKQRIKVKVVPETPGKKVATK